MGRIYCMLGKSSSGKDTLYRMLREERTLSLRTMIPYTTRPMRAEETDGVEYVFCNEQRASELERQGRIIEMRAYETVHGIWRYFTVDDGQVDLEHQNYLMIGTLASYLKIREYYGKEKVVPIYIEIEDGIRLQRALNRERSQKTPRYEELCRRFLADSNDFSEEKLTAAEITVRFENNDLTETKENIVKYMLQ